MRSNAHESAEEKAESAVSGVGMVADQTRYARSVAEAAIAEARSVRDEVTSRIAEVAQRSDVSASNIAEVLTGKVQQVAAQFEAHTSHAVGQVAQQLEQEVKAVATGAAATQEQSTRTAIETKAAVEQISTQLAQLATQMAEFQSARNADVAMGENQSLQDVDVRLQAQSQRIDTVSESVQKIERDSVDNTQLLHDLVTGMENLGESLKTLRSEVKAWEEEEIPMETDEEKAYKEMQKSIIEEVSLSFPHVENAANASASIPFSMPAQIPVSVHPSDFE